MHFIYSIRKRHTGYLSKYAAFSFLFTQKMPLFTSATIPFHKSSPRLADVYIPSAFHCIVTIPQIVLASVTFPHAAVSP